MEKEFLFEADRIAYESWQQLQKEKAQLDEFLKGPFHGTKEFFTELELKALRNHSGLKFVMFDGNLKRRFTCYRVTISGGLDACNKKADSIDRDFFGVKIFKRTGIDKSEEWRQVAYLERDKGGSFNH